jgi:hypothetical protein
MPFGLNMSYVVEYYLLVKKILQHHIIYGRCHPIYCDERQVKHIYNMNLLTKHRWLDVKLYIQYKSLLTKKIQPF